MRPDDTIETDEDYEVNHVPFFDAHGRATVTKSTRRSPRIDDPNGERDFELLDEWLEP